MSKDGVVVFRGGSVFMYFFGKYVKYRKICKVLVSTKYTRYKWERGKV